MPEFSKVNCTDCPLQTNCSGRRVEHYVEHASGTNVTEEICVRSDELAQRVRERLGLLSLPTVTAA